MKNYPHRAEPRLRRPLSQARLVELAAATLLFIFAVTGSAPAQTISTQTQNDVPLATEGIEKGWNEFGIWGGFSFNAPTLIGKTPDARFGNLGLRYGRVLATNKTVAFEYTIDAVPVAILSTKRFTPVEISPGVFSVQETRESVYGAGLSRLVLGLTFEAQTRPAICRPHRGFLYFQRDVPIAGAAQV